SMALSEGLTTMSQNARPPRRPSILRVAPLAAACLFLVGMGLLWQATAFGLQRRLGLECNRQGPHFSPGGSRLCFSSPAAGSGDIYTAKLDGSDSKRLTSTAATDTQPIYSPDGAKIAFVRSSKFRDDVAHVWIMDVDGSNPRQITEGDVLDLN